MIYYYGYHMDGFVHIGTEKTAFSVLVSQCQYKLRMAKHIDPTKDG